MWPTTIRRWHGWRAGMLALAIGVVVAGCGGTASGSGIGGKATHGGSPAACVSDSTSVDGVATQSFCGNASAQVSVTGTTIPWQHGECETAGGNFSVRFGREILGTGTAAETLKKTYDYFGVTVIGASKDGIYSQNGAVVMEYHGAEYTLVNYTISLASNETQGTFGGTDATSNQPMSGTFTCN